MSLPRFAIRRPVATYMFYLSVCMVGLFAWFHLPVDLMPNAAPGTLSVYIGVRGGLPPEEIENLVTKPVEESVATVQHLRSVLSESRKDRSTVTLTYEPGTDLGFAALEVQERLAKIKNKLPKDIEKPIVAHYSDNDYPVMILSLTSDRFSPEHLRDLVDNKIKPDLMRLNGVANVEVGGGRERKILVEFYQDRLEAYSLGIRQVIDVIGKQNLNLLSGKRDEGAGSVSIRIGGTYKTIEDLKNLVVHRSPEGSSIRLGDIADVKDFYLEAQSYARLNRKPTVSVYVQKANDSNTIRVAERVRAAVGHFEKDILGPDIKMDLVTDQSVFISEAMDNVIGNLTGGILLTLLVIFYFLREWRHTLIVFLSAPIAVAMTLGFLWVVGLSINVMTLSALALAIGIVVDSATVVLENVLDRKRHHHHRGETVALGEATASATEELMISLLGGTLTMVVVFLPIVFINQQVKILYSGLAYTITFAMVSSLLVATSLVPVLASRIGLPTYSGYLPPAWAARWHRWREAGAAATPVWVSRVGGAVWGRARRIFPSEPPSNLWRPPVEEELHETSENPGLWTWIKYYWLGWAWPEWLKEIRMFRRHPRRAFVRWSALSLRHQRVISLVMAALTVGSVLMYVFLLKKDFMGSTEQNEFIVFIELPAGAKLDVSDSVVREVERVLSETPEVSDTVKSAAARVEGWSSKVYVTLKPRSERSRSVQDIIRDLRPKVSDIGQQFDTFIYFSEPESSKEFFIDVFGYDYDKLRDLASAIAQRLEKVNGLADIKLRYKPGQPEVRVMVDMDRAPLLGFTVRDIAEDLHARVRGLRPSYFFTDASQMEIIARDKEQFRKSLEDIYSLNLFSPLVGNVSIQQVARFEFSLTASEVWRKDKQRVIQVSANREKLALSSAASRSLSVLKGLNAPEGYYFQIGGDYLDMVQNEKEFRFAFIVMAGLVFVVLASLFESCLQALLIMATLPMALIGSIPLLYITNTSATMSVYIGIIMLGGVAVSPAIIIVEKINQARAEGRELKRAVLESSLVRLSPILNTSLTTIVDLIPMALSRAESAQLWAPLSLTVIGGATVSTFMTLFMIPALYYHLETIREKITLFR